MIACSDKNSEVNFLEVAIKLLPVQVVVRTVEPFLVIEGQRPFTNLASFSLTFKLFVALVAG